MRFDQVTSGHTFLAIRLQQFSIYSTTEPHMPYLCREPFNFMCSLTGKMHPLTILWGSILWALARNKMHILLLEIASRVLQHTTCTEIIWWKEPCRSEPAVSWVWHHCRHQQQTQLSEPIRSLVTTGSRQQGKAHSPKELLVHKNKYPCSVWPSLLDWVPQSKLL